MTAPEMISSHDHGNCELCDLLEARLTAMLGVVEAAGKLNDAYDVFENALVVGSRAPGHEQRCDAQTFKMVDSPEAWHARHKIETAQHEFETALAALAPEGETRMLRR
jgi:hypothetical protein